MDNNGVKVMSSKDLDELGTISDASILLRGLRLLNAFNNQCRLNSEIPERKIEELKNQAINEIRFLKKEYGATDHDSSRLEGLVISVAGSFLKNRRGKLSER